MNLRGEIATPIPTPERKIHNEAMDFFLLTQDAKNEAEALVDRIRRTGSVSFPPSDEYPLSLLKEGVMLGTLIAETKDGERKVLYGYSGALSGRYNIPGYVHTCFSEKDWDEYMSLYDSRIHLLTRLIEEGDESLREERRELSAAAQEEYAGIFRFYNWRGEKIRGLPPHSPTGTGECAGLKLINTALKRGWEIKGLAEFRYSPSSDTIVYTPPCSERCGLLLPSMLGLEYIYLDSDIAIVNKRAGELSVPGRGEEKRDSVSYRFHTLFPSSPETPHVHRLDMDTSGLMVLAFTPEAKKDLSLQFEKREVRKTYIALLEGVIKEEEGDIELPMRLDVEHRPVQIVDFENGKSAFTHWERLSVERHDGKLCTRVRFFPRTGRTHQLRVHASSGLGHPIIGDNLYGKREAGERLCLHAESITLRHPGTGEMISFTSVPEF